MPNWVYEARNRAGQRVQGDYDAPDRQTAAEFLRGQGLFLTRLEVVKGGGHQVARGAAAAAVATAVEVPSRPGASIERAPERTGSSPTPTSRPLSTSANPAHYNGRTATAPIPNQPFLRANSKDLSIYFRQVGSMIHAGTTIGQAMKMMSEDAPNEGLRRASEQIQARAMSGELVSESMRSFPGLFTPLQIGMVNAGERGGFLDSTYERLSKYSERDYELQQMIKRETWYPKLLVFASILIPSAVPLVIAAVKGGENPFMAWLKDVTPPLLVVAAIWALFKGINYIAPYSAHQNSLKLTIDRIKLATPVMGKVVRGLATAKFCRAMGALYSAGVGPGEAIRLSATACGNAAIARSAIDVIPNVERGESLTDSLKSTGHFPKMVMQVMKIGEDSGSIDTQLDKAADFLENDAEVAIMQSIKVLGILVFLFIAARIGMQVAQFWSGYFNGMFEQAEQAVSGP